MALVIPAPGSSARDFGACNPLVVDPYLGNRRLMRETLRDLGCARVQDTGKVPDAWKALREGGVSVVFLDWSGDIDAIDFLHRLRDPEDPNRFVPVVVMSAFGLAEHIVTVRDAGATEFMLRPFSPEVIASRLRSIVLHPRLFIRGGRFFGPDRRRRRLEWSAEERRKHENWRSGDRRNGAESEDWNGSERRQGRPGFVSLDRRNAQRV